MNAIATHRQALKAGFEILHMVVADLTPAQAHWQPPGIANPAGAQYAHAALSADAVAIGMLQGLSPLFIASWAGRTGVSQPQPQATLEWARTVQVDLPALHAYTAAVAAAVDAYIAGLSENDLERLVDLSAFGQGQRTVDWVLSAVVTGHLNNMAGEISVLKGLQGAKGYPF
jgi:hypothetical protein